MKPFKIESLRIEQLACNTKDFSFLINENIEVKAGEALAVLGPNGSGKSTFIEALLGLREAEKYTVLLNDHSFYEMKERAANRKHIGALLQGALYHGENIKVCEIVDLHRAVYGELDKVVYEALFISGLLNKSFNKLSQGQRQRVKLFLALSHLPPLIFLDEYGTALDSKQSIEVLELMKQVLKMGLICVYASHSRLELELADSVVLLDSGQVLVHGNARSLCQTFLGTHCLNIKFNYDDDFTNALKIFEMKYECKAIIDLGRHAVQVFGDSALLGVYNDAELNNTFYSFRLREVVKGDLLTLSSNWKQFSPSKNEEVF